MSRGAHNAQPRLLVAEVKLSEPGEAIRDFRLELPATGQEADSYTLRLEGWALGAAAPVARVDVVSADYGIRSVPVEAPSPDAAAAHPGIDWAAGCGFSGALSTVPLPSGFNLRVVAELADGGRFALATIEGRRRALPVPSEPGPAPLMLTTLGRSGSTWVVGLLGSHPQVIAYMPYRLEPRSAAYWSSVFTTLAEPRSYLQSIAADTGDRDEWWTGAGRVPPLVRFDRVDSGMDDWLGGEQVDRLAGVCRDQIAAFYRRAAGPDDHRRARYFVEKLWPWGDLQRPLRTLYAGAREVFLVRDFRDRACSVLAFDAKRGDKRFRHDAAQGSEEYIAGPLLDQAASLLSSWRRRAADSFLLRYEDLVREPRATLARLLSHLDLEGGDAAVDSMIAGAQGMGRQDFYRTAADAATSVGRWRRDLSAAEQAVFGDRYAEVLRGFGYEP